MSDFQTNFSRTENELAEALVEALTDGKVTEEEGKTIGSAILEGMEKVTDQQQLDLFLVSLREKWPFLSPLPVETLQDNDTQKTKEKLQEVKSELEVLVKQKNQE